MDVILIDVGALATFLAYLAIMYWHGVSRETQSTRQPGEDQPRQGTMIGTARRLTKPRP